VVQRAVRCYRRKGEENNLIIKPIFFKQDIRRETHTLKKIIFRIR
jgi:hypothetical protein